MRTIFPTVIHELKVENFKSLKNKLVQFVYEQQKKDLDGVNFSNVGGWQSQPNYNTYDNILLSTISETLMPYFKNNVLDMSKEIKYEGLWMNINKKGNHNATHDHPGCHIAGVFWINSPPGCGNLEMQSPNSFNMGTEMMMYTEEFQKKSSAYPVYMFPPTEGSILLFPACINHRVTFNESDGDRISSAFNLTFNL
tara:strand:+ start:70 stop:657 length:588 start_codon:yes stop_codon:yes gene_type:complete